MEHFQDIFQQAVSIKNSQMQSRRQKFESQPQFIKAGLYYLNKFENVRDQSFNLKLMVSEDLKQNGNSFFKANEFEKAAHEYEQALSIFRFIKNNNKNWKNEGILDDDLEYVEETGSSLQESEKLKNLKVNIYINLALTYLKSKKLGYSIMASEEALKLDPKNTKALFRKAKAKITDINAGIKEFSEAYKDLELALQNEPEDMTIKDELIKVAEEIKRLKILDKKSSFTGIFNKTPAPKTTSSDPKPNKIQEETKKIGYDNSSKSQKENVQENAEKKTQNLTNMNYNLSYEVDPNAKIPKEIDELGNFLNHKGPQIVKLYEATGKLKEAEELKEKLKTALAAKDQLEKIASLDFNKPTPHLKEMAEKLNIDLLDPSIKNELLKVQAQNIIDLRKWLDDVNKNPEKIIKSTKLPGPQVENHSKDIFKTSTSQTQIGNNYFINNNFYSSNVSTNETEQSEKPEKKKEKEKKDICKKCEQDLSKVNGKDGNSFSTFMNYFIVVLALVLIVLTLILHYFSD